VFHQLLAVNVRRALPDVAASPAAAEGDKVSCTHIGSVPLVAASGPRPVLNVVAVPVIEAPLVTRVPPVHDVPLTAAPAPARTVIVVA
jgi:hypothetical protein